MLVNSSEDRDQIRIQAVDFVLAAPLPQDETAVREAGQIVRDAALLVSQLVGHFTYVVGPVPKELHDGETGLVGQGPEELAIELGKQGRLLPSYDALCI